MQLLDLYLSNTQTPTCKRNDFQKRTCKHSHTNTLTHTHKHTHARTHTNTHICLRGPLSSIQQKSNISSHRPAERQTNYTCSDMWLSSATHAWCLRHTRSLGKSTLSMQLMASYFTVRKLQGRGSARARTCTHSARRSEKRIPCGSCHVSSRGIPQPHSDQQLVSVHGSASIQGTKRNKWFIDVRWTSRKLCRCGVTRINSGRKRLQGWDAQKTNRTWDMMFCGLLKPHCAPFFFY